jgi:hypothetical protein
VAERTKETEVVELSALLEKNMTFDLRTAEALEERESRL